MRFIVFIVGISIISLVVAYVGWSIRSSKADKEANEFLDRAEKARQDRYMTQGDMDWLRGHEDLGRGDFTI